METESHSNRFLELHDKFNALLYIGDFVAVNSLMQTFLNENSSIGDLKTILVTTKAFKQNEALFNTRKLILALLENKLGTKLI